MPNHATPIESATLWDILDWDTACALAATAPADPRDDNGAHVMATVAKMVIDEGSKNDSDGGEGIFLRYASHCLGYGAPAVRRQKAAGLAHTFGADPERLIDFLAYKRGLFGRAKKS
jgi:hypothetical protein